MSDVKNLLQFLNIALLVAVASSKYDIEAAALKHYGVSFYSVLNNFRRSSNYWKILFDKMEDIRLRMKDNEQYHKQFFVVHELRDRVDSILGIKPKEGRRSADKNSLGCNKMLRHNIPRFKPSYRRAGADLPPIVVNKTIVNTLESLPLMMNGGLDKKTANRIVDSMFNLTQELIDHLIESVGTYSLDQYGGTHQGSHKAARTLKKEKRKTKKTKNATKPA